MFVSVGSMRPHMNRFAIAALTCSIVCSIACSPSPSTPPAIDAGQADAGTGRPAEFVDPEGEPPAVAWSDGPYGEGIRDIAAPFVLPLADGTTYDLRAGWTGLDSHLFVVRHGASDYARQLWESPVLDLFSRMPENVHLFFLSADASASEDWKSVKSRLDRVLEASPAVKVRWEQRIHFVAQQATTLEGWLGPYIARERPIAFAIDRAQRLREAGLLSNVTGDQKPRLEYLANEAVGFNFEARRDWLLTLREATVVPVLQGERIGAWSDRFFDVTLPSAEQMAAFDTLELDFTEGCEDHRDRNCGDWDLIVDLFVCDAAAPDTCDARLGRWITTYKREGRWVTDVSALMALLEGGGTRRFKLSSGQSFVGDLSLRFSTRHKGRRPVGVLPLFSGGAFDANYNALHPEIRFTLPPGTRRVELVASPTGHGFGDDRANCAEFCNHEHRFTLNGQEFVRDFPMAGSFNGCRDAVAQGVVPNQFGTWPLGRGGWCPGWDVAPWVVDVSDVILGGENVITYRGTFQGADYRPEKLQGGSEFAARIDLSSALIFWR